MYQINKLYTLNLHSVICKMHCNNNSITLIVIINTHLIGLLNGLSQVLSTSALLTFGAGKFFDVGKCSVYRRMFSSMSSFYLLDASRTSPNLLVVTTKTLSPEIDKYLLGGKLAPT